MLFSYIAKALYMRLKYSLISAAIIHCISSFFFFFTRGGYKVIPKSYEFWCGRTNRLHDRLKFRLPVSQEVPDNKLSYAGENGWIYEYLSP